MSRRRVLITGLTGQDGGYLAELLLDGGDEVLGTVRGAPDALARSGLTHLTGRVALLEADLLEPASIHRAITAAQPHEIYHLAAPTDVNVSRRDPDGTFAQIVGGTQAVLGAAADVGRDVRVLVASSREIFGDTTVSPQREDAPTHPDSPYGEAKLEVHRLLGRLRAEQDRFLVSAILFNHESPRRPCTFVPRKITKGVARIAAGLTDELTLWNTDSVRDWSHVRDIVEGMVLALRYETPDDYVFASGVPRTVDQFVDAAFAAAGVSRRRPDGSDRVVVDRPGERREQLDPVGDSTHARERLGWEPRIGFEELVAEMVEADLERVGRGPS